MKVTALVFLMVFVSDYGFAAKVMKATSSYLYLTFTEAESRRFQKGDSIEISNDEVSITGDIVRISGKNRAKIDCDDPEAVKKGDIVQVYLYDEPSMTEDDDNVEDTSYEYDTDPLSSEAQREGKRFSLNVSTNGVLHEIENNSGIELGVYLDPYRVVQFGYESATQGSDFLSVNSTWTYMKFTGFSGNSFYASASFGLMTTDVAFLSEGLKTNRFGVETSIGNQWHFQNLSIGVNWLGFYHPISTQTKSTVVSQYLQDTGADLYDLADSYSDGSAYAFRLSIGFSM